MKKHKAWRTAFWPLALSITAFAFPLASKAVPIALMFAGLFWLVSGPDIRKLQQVWKNPGFWAPIAFFVLHGLGLLWSPKLMGWHVALELKLSFVVLPIMIFTGPNLTSRAIRMILTAFIVGCVIAGVVNMAAGLVEVFEEGAIPERQLTGVGLSALLHRGYYSIYLNMSVAILLWAALRQRPLLPWRPYAEVFTLVFMALMIILLMSKTAIVVLFIQTSLTLILWVRQSGRARPGLIAGLLGLIILGTILRFSPAFERLEAMVEVFYRGGENEGESNMMRLNAWKTSVEVLASRPVTGFGTIGDQAAMNHVYQANGHEINRKLNVNSHQQLLQSGIKFGIVGAAFVGFLLFTPVIRGFKRQDLLLLLFGINVALSAMAESIFEVQAGVVFFCFWYVLLLYRNQHIGAP